MNTRAKIYILFVLTLSLATNACSRLQDDEFSSVNQELTANTLALDFSAEVNTTTYQSVVFSNRSENAYYEIFNIAKTDDVCAAFSLYNITDSNDQVLYDAKQTTGTATSGQTYSLAIVVAPGDSVNINIEFSPIPCEKKEYQPNLIIYYNTESTTETQTITMHATVLDNSTTNTCGEKHQIADLSEMIGEEPSRILPELAHGYYYAFVPYEIHGYIQPTEGFASLATEMYAYFDNPNVPEPGYQAPYLPLNYHEDGHLSLLTIDACRGFEFTTSLTDTYFLGAKQLLTTESDFDIFVETTDADHLGELSIPYLQPTVSANINNSGSILQSSDGNFVIKLDLGLTTNYTETNNYLQNAIGKVVDEDGFDYLRIEANGDDSRMYGSPLRHGEMILVGVGTFAPDGYEMSAEATSGLIDTMAYIFIQFHMKVVILSEEEIPIATSLLTSP